MAPIREVLSQRSRSVVVEVVDGRVSSVRTGDESETVVRVYDEGLVGVSSAVGPHVLGDVITDAHAALRHGVPHAPGPVREGTLELACGGVEYDSLTLVEAVESLFETLRAAHPELLFSNKIYSFSEELGLTNDAGLDLHFSHATTVAAILVKRRGSAGLMDAILMHLGPSLDVDAVVGLAAERLGPIVQPLGRPPEGRIRAVFEGLGPLEGKLRRDLTARSIRADASLFSSRSSGFHKDFRLIDTLDGARWRICPFDMEGATRGDLDLIANSHVAAQVADRRDAARLGIESTANAHGNNWHTLPSSQVGEVLLGPTTPGLSGLLGAEDTVFVSLSMGADCSDTGDYAIPVQLGYRLRSDGTIGERLAPFTLTGHLFDVFGDGFVGVSEVSAHPGTRERWFATHLTVA